ncbi:hypothetical protein EV715DRAFT_268539 [Schizophyllum commune]
MSFTLEADLEGPRRVLELSRSLSVAGIGPQRKAFLRQAMINLAIRPSFLQYLSTTDPAAIPADEWTPSSPTVKAISVSFDAISAITRAWSLQSSSTHVALRCASTFFPASIRWIPYLHPIHSSLQPDGAHIHALVDLILALHTFAECSPIPGEHLAILDEYTVTLWAFVLVQPDIDLRPNRIFPLCSEMLARCILTFLLPAAEGRVGRTDMPSVRIMVRHALWCATKRRPSKLLRSLLEHSRAIHLLDTIQSKSKEFSAMRWHIHLLAVLIRDVYPTWRPSRTVLKIAVDLGRESPCACTTMATCALLITIWEKDHSGRSLIWSIKAGLVDALTYGSDGEPANLKEARAAVFRYITYRTSSVGVLRALLKKGASVPFLVGTAAFPEREGTMDQGQLTQDVHNAVQSRVDSLGWCILKKVCATCGADSASSRFSCLCYNAIYCSRRCQKQHWRVHRDCCLWYIYRLSVQLADNIGSPFDMGFSLVQIIRYLLSDRADYLFERLAKLKRLPGNEVRVEVALDQVPPRDNLKCSLHTGLDSENVMTLEARLFVRGKASVVGFQPMSLASFLEAFEGVSTYFNLDNQPLTIGKRKAQ